MMIETKTHQHNDTEMSNNDIDSAYVESDAEFQGLVRLLVEAFDSVRQVMLFVSELRQMGYIRILEIRKTTKEGVWLQLSLRRTIPLISVLGKMEGVSKVETSRGKEEHDEEPQVYVQLAVLERIA